jgi:hypothetical protein
MAIATATTTATTTWAECQLQQHEQNNIGTAFLGSCKYANDQTLPAGIKLD